MTMRALMPATTSSPGAGSHSMLRPHRRPAPIPSQPRGSTQGRAGWKVVLPTRPGLVSARVTTAAAASVNETGGRHEGGGALNGARSRSWINKNLSVKEVRAELVSRGEDATGKKDELVDRLYLAVRASEGGGDARDEDVSEATTASNSSVSSSSGVEGEDDAKERSREEPRRDRDRDRDRDARPAIQRTMFNSRPAERVSGGNEISDDSASNFSGMEIVFLGTSSGSPSFTRNVSSYALRLTDEIWLFDCGEATQHQLMRSSLKYTKITRIFITHMHGDHIFGLPGLICALSGSRAEQLRVHGKEPEPLYITGPPGICDYVRAAMTCSRTVLGLPLVVTELTAPGNGMKGAGAGDDADPRGASKQMHLAADGRCKLFLGERWPDNGAAAAPGFQQRDAWSAAWNGQLELPYWTVHRERPRNRSGRGGGEGGLVVRAAPLRHPVPCFGYVVDEPDQPGRMDVEKATALGLPPGKEYKRLKEGQSVQTADGNWVHPEDVLGPDRPGRRLCLLGDTCDSVGIAPLALGADVLVHESTFAAFKHGEAVFKGHSTSAMAGEFARMIKARNLLLTHFSNRYGTANTRSGGADRLEGRRGNRGGQDDDVEDDMALPEEAPEDMKAAMAEEFTLVEGLVREAAEAKGDSRVVAASDFFAFNVQRREAFDDVDRAKGNREAIFDGPEVTPARESVGDARRRIDSGFAGYQSPSEPAGPRGSGGYRGDRGGRGGRGGSYSYSSGYGGGRGRRDGATHRGRSAGPSSHSSYGGGKGGGDRGRQEHRDVGSYARGGGELGTGGGGGDRYGTNGGGRTEPRRVRDAGGFDMDSASIDSAALMESYKRRGRD